jgi:hypothetical protein
LVGFEVLTAVVMKSTILWDKKYAEQETSVKTGATCFLLNLFFDPEDGGDIFFRNVG